MRDRPGGRTVPEAEIDGPGRSERAPARQIERGVEVPVRWSRVEEIGAGGGGRDERQLVVARSEREVVEVRPGPTRVSRVGDLVVHAVEAAPDEDGGAR